jgi:hypothetical protein
MNLRSAVANTVETVKDWPEAVKDWPGVNIVDVAGLFSRFPVPPNPLAPKPKRRSIKIGALKAAVEAKAAELQLLSGSSSVGSPDYFRVEAEYNRLRVELEYKQARRAAIERCRQGEIHYGRLKADAEAEVRALAAELKAVEARDPERVTGEAYALTNKAMQLAHTVRSCDDLINGRNQYDQMGQLVRGFRGDLEVLEKEKADAGDLD